MKAALIAIAVIVLGAMQLASDGLLNAEAEPASVPRLVPHAAGVAAFATLPLPAFMRSVAAGVAIDDGRFSDAQAAIASLPPGRERDDLAGRILAARGDARAAVVQFVAAGDLPRVSEAVDSLAARGDWSAALAQQREIVARLRRLGDLEGLAHAQWRLAQLEALSGDGASALRDYQAALQLVPLSETYLLGAANEALGTGHLDLAQQYYERVLTLDPSSADGRRGLARVQERLRAKKS